jgi:rod shape-determining protein MreB
MSTFFKQVVYVQLAPNKLTVRNPKSGKSVSDVPELAVRPDAKGKRVVAAVGSGARQLEGTPGTEVLNPFAHPRSLLSDFSIAEKVLQYFVREALPASFLRPAPAIVMHPLVDPEGGFTQIELRAMRELAMGVGASRVTIWLGRPLSDQELLSGTFPAGGEVHTG